MILASPRNKDEVILVKNQLIYPRQLIFTLLACGVPAGILPLMQNLFIYTGRDTWIAVLISAIPPALSIMSFLYVCRKFPRQELVGILEQLFGKVMSKIFGFIFVLYFIAFSALFVEMFCNMFGYFLLPDTPIFLILLLFCVLVFYLVTSGLKIIARFCEITFYLFMLSLLLTIPSIFQAEHTNLLPIGHTPLEAYLPSIMTMLVPMSFCMLIPLTYAHVTKKKNAGKLAYISMALTILLTAYLAISLILVSGPEQIESNAWSLLLIYESSEFYVLEKIDLLWFLFWVFLSVRPAAIFAFSADKSVKEMVPTAYKKPSWVSAGLVALVLISAALIHYFKIATELIMIMQPGFIFLALMLPAAMAIVCKSKGIKKPATQEDSE